MNDAECQSLLRRLDAVSEMLGRPALSATARSMYIASLRQYPADMVFAALNSHCTSPSEGRFMPTVAHIIGQLQKMDGRPESDEAWGIALQAFDDAATVVMTEEIAQAMGAARPLMDVRDKVAARMAFKDAYERMVNEARVRMQPAAWNISEGSDKYRRFAAVEQAARLGRLKPEQVDAYLRLSAPAPKAVPLLQNLEKAGSTPESRKTVEQLKDLIAGKPAYLVEAEKAKIVSKQTEEERRKMLIAQARGENA